MSETSPFEQLLDHVVLLCWVEEFTTRGNANVQRVGNYATGFVVMFDNIAWLITAGHIIEALRDPAKEKLGFRITSPRIVEAKRRFPAIPFPLEDPNECRIYKEESGEDFAALAISPIIAQGLLAAGVVPIDDTGYREAPGDLFEPDHPQEMYLIGFPHELQEFSVTSSGSLEVVSRPYALRLEPERTPPTSLDKSSNRIYGKLPEGSLIINSIRGMSGGPVVLMREVEPGRIRYWVIAVQSGWDTRRRVIAATPINQFIESTQQAIREMKSES